MDRKQLFLGVLSLAFLGCGGTKKVESKNPPSTTSKPASTQAASAPKEEPRTDYLLVLSTTPQTVPDVGWLNTYQTVWIKATPNGFEEIASHDGVALSDGKSLWFWTDKNTPEQQADCVCVEKLFEKEGEISPEEEKACLTKKRNIPKAVFVELNGKELAVKERIVPSTSTSSPTSEPETINLSEGTNKLEFGFVVGPWVFYEEHSYYYGCGAAHGGTGVGYSAVDLRKAQLGLPWSEAEKDGFTRPHLEKVKAELCTADYVSDGMSGCDKIPFDAEVTAVFPSVEGGVLQMIVQYTVGSSYADSDGRYASYTRSARVPVALMPGFLSDFKEIPAAVKAYWAKNSSSQKMGWSAITGSPKELDALKEKFSKAPSMNLKVMGEEVLTEPE